MPYLERVTKAGMTIEVERYYSSRYRRKGIERGDRVKARRKIGEMQSESSGFS